MAESKVTRRARERMLASLRRDRAYVGISESEANYLDRVSDAARALEAAGMPLTGEEYLRVTGRRRPAGPAPR